MGQRVRVNNEGVYPPPHPKPSSHLGTDIAVTAVRALALDRPTRGRGSSLIHIRAKFPK